MTQTLTKRMATPTLLRAFSWVAIIEACTWIGLLAGMYLKHVTETTELGVRIFGSLHGAAFIRRRGLFVHAEPAPPSPDEGRFDPYAHVMVDDPDR